MVASTVLVTRFLKHQTKNTEVAGFAPQKKRKNTHVLLSVVVMFQKKTAIHLNLNRMFFFFHMFCSLLSSWLSLRLRRLQRLIITGEARYAWLHGIAWRKTDCLEEGTMVGRVFFSRPHWLHGFFLGGVSRSEWWCFFFGGGGVWNIFQCDAYHIHPSTNYPTLFLLLLKVTMCCFRLAM